MLKFDIIKQTDLMRAGVIHTAHGDIETPAFVGAATRAAMKAVTWEQLQDLGSQAVLVNAYHMLLAPKVELIERAGGINHFMSWDKPTFTDSGGFQMLSLTDAKIDADGVTFKSYLNGDKIRMTPEISMQAQWQIGSDIHMAFDQAIDSDNYLDVKKAMERTHEWLPRNLAEHEKMQKKYAKSQGSITEYQKASSNPPHFGHNPTQYLYAIAQGGRFEDLRKQSAEFMRTQPVDGFGLGSLYTTETTAEQELIKITNEILPAEKPRHLLGMGGEPRDLYVGVEYGCDTFDCVAPTRMARNGALYTRNGRINIKNAKYREHFAPVDAECDCLLCQNYTAAYLHHLFKVDEITAKVLASLHNERWVIRAVDEMRAVFLAEGKTGFLRLKNKRLAEYYGSAS